MTCLQKQTCFNETFILFYKHFISIVLKKARPSGSREHVLMVIAEYEVTFFKSKFDCFILFT